MISRLLAAGAVAVLVAGCGGDSHSSAPSTPSAAATSGAAPTSGPTTTFTSAFVGKGDVFFLSPSRNIGCAVSETAVRCDIREHTWSPPPRPASCKLDFGGGVNIVGASPATMTCAGDTVLVGDAVLDYGSMVTRGDFECRSEMAAMRCRNRKSGHSFSLARETVTLG